MAVLDENLDLRPAPCSASLGGMRLRGSIRTNYHLLASRFGPPDFPSHDPGDQSAEDATLWAVDTPAGRVHVHNWLDVRYFLEQPYTETRWNIQAAGDGALPWICKAIFGSTAAFPAAVHESSRFSTRPSLTGAYVDYLVQRMLALREQAEQRDPGSPERRQHIELSRHLGHMALQVQQILHHHEWAHTDDTGRRAWTRMPMPQLVDEPELRHWRLWTRWSYQPAPTDDRPEGGNPDLSGMLRDRARDQVRFRDRVLPANRPGPTRDRKIKLYDEHIGTLFTLADTRLPETSFKGARP